MEEGHGSYGESGPSSYDGISTSTSGISVIQTRPDSRVKLNFGPVSGVDRTIGVRLEEHLLELGVDGGFARGRGLGEALLDPCPGTSAGRSVTCSQYLDTHFSWGGQEEDMEGQCDERVRNSEARWECWLAHNDKETSRLTTYDGSRKAESNDPFST